MSNRDEPRRERNEQISYPPHRAYVVNAGTDDVSVIDIRSHEVIATIAAGEEPMMAALCADRRHLSIGGAFNARPLGAQVAVLVGGEPTTRQDLGRLLSAVRRHGLVPGLVTNGRMLVYPEARARLLDGGVGYLRVGLHGPDAAIHDPLVGVAGAFEQTLADRCGAWATGRRRPDPIRCGSSSCCVPRMFEPATTMACTRSHSLRRFGARGKNGSWTAPHARSWELNRQRP